MTTLECDGALSDLILQAARAAIPAHVDSMLTVPDVGPRNQPLLPLLVGLIGAAEPVAAAIADNCWDDSLPVPAGMAKGMADALHKLADTITTAAAAPDRTDWSLPSMSGKELV